MGAQRAVFDVEVDARGRFDRDLPPTGTTGRTGSAAITLTNFFSFGGAGGGLANAL